MTTFQDQPPQSRRSLRQERARAEEIDDSAEAERAPSGRRARAAEPEGLVEVANEHSTGADAVDASNAPDADVSHSDAPHAAEAAVVTDSATPKAFPFADQVEATSDDAGHPGFRLRDFTPELSTARAESQSASAWKPSNDEESVALDYQTQGSPALGYVSPYTEPVAEERPQAQPEPSFDSLFSDLLAPEAEAEAEAEADVEADADANHTASAESDVAEPEAGSETSSTESALPIGEPVVVSEPVALVAPLVVPSEERTLSRREWRAMRAAAEAEALTAAGGSPTEDASAEAPTADASAADEATAATDQASVETPAVSSQSADEPVADSSVGNVELLFHKPDPSEAQQPEATQSDASRSEASQPETGHDSSSDRDAFIPPLVEPVAAPQSALSDAMAEFEALTRSAAPAAPVEDRRSTSTNEQPVEPAVFDTPSADRFASAARAQPTEPPVPADLSGTRAAESTPFSFLLNPSTAAAPTPADGESEAYTPPIGHWSRQAELDDENQPFENTLSRDVGGGNVATTTNALVLPMIPQRDDFSSVLNATGEIMVTGTINLPGSVGTTGRDSRHYDDPEVDHLFDALDNEIPNTDSAPVRAITAVSSHTATRSGIEPGRKQNNRVLTILLVTAGVMAVSVLGLLVAGFVFHIF